jgi:hypothetical protein
MTNETKNRKDRTSNPIRLTRMEMVKTFRMIRNCRDGKIECSLQQLQAGEVLMRLAMEYSEHNPFRQVFSDAS